MLCFIINKLKTSKCINLVCPNLNIIIIIKIKRIYFKAFIFTFCCISMNVHDNAKYGT